MIFSVRPMTNEDLEPVLMLEQKLFSQPHSLQQFSGFLHSQGECLVAVCDTGIVGYIVASCGGGEADVISIAVDSSVQQQGVAGGLLTRLGARLYERRTEQLFLEVRVSNLAAIGCYRKYGFEQVGCRKNYYRSPDGTREDALVFRLQPGV